MIIMLNTLLIFEKLAHCTILIPYSSCLFRLLALQSKDALTHCQTLGML